MRFNCFFGLIPFLKHDAVPDHFPESIKVKFVGSHDIKKLFLYCLAQKIPSLKLRVRTLRTTLYKFIVMHFKEKNLQRCSWLFTSLPNSSDVKLLVVSWHSGVSILSKVLLIYAFINNGNFLKNGGVKCDEICKHITSRESRYTVFLQRHFPASEYLFSAPRGLYLVEFIHFFQRYFSRFRVSVQRSPRTPLS